MKARWYIESVPANPNVGTCWMLYAVILILSIALVVIFLPTSYSLGLLDILRYALQILLYIFTLLQLLLFTPLIALFSLIARLLGKTETPSAQATMPPIVPTPSPSQVAPPNNFLDLIKSLIFWGVFLFVVVYAFRHYVMNHRGLALGFQRVFGWINFSKAWNWIKRQFIFVNRQLATVVDNSINRIRSLISQNSVSIDPIGRLSRLLPARQRIMLIYVTMIRWNSHNGINRKDNQTPNEYARVLSFALPDNIPDIDGVTQAFIEARYTRHSISNQQANNVQEAVDRIQAAIRANLEQKQQLEHQL